MRLSVVRVLDCKRFTLRLLLGFSQYPRLSTPYLPVSVLVDWTNVSAAFNATFLRVECVAGERERERERIFKLPFPSPSSFISDRIQTEMYSVDISWVPPYEVGYPNLARLNPLWLGVVQVWLKLLPPKRANATSPSLPRSLTLTRMRGFARLPTSP